MLKAKQENNIRLNESNKPSKNMKGETESIIFCLKEDIKKIETAKECFKKHLQHQRDEIAKINVWLQSEISPGTKLKIISKRRQGAIEKLSHMVRMLEARAGEIKSGLLCNPTHSSHLKEDFKDITTSQEYVSQYLPHQRNKTSDLQEYWRRKLN